MKYGNKTIGLQGLVDEFLFTVQVEGRARRTHEYYAKLLRHFLVYAKKQGWSDRVDLINGSTIREFLSWVATRSFQYSPGNGSRRFTRSKPSTALPYYKALRRLFNWSVEEGLIDESPMRGVHFRLPPLAPVYPYTREELQKFLAVCELDARSSAPFTGLRNRAMLLLFINSGLRLSESANLRLGDLNLEQRWV